jgi:mono/diheme cytochrome c family protein
MKDGQLVHVLTYGQGNMASFASQLALDQRWRVIAYVRDLQAKAPAGATTPKAAATPAASPDLKVPAAGGTP